MKKYIGFLIYVFIQLTLILLLGFDVIDRTFWNFVWVTAITWMPWCLVLVLKVVEKLLIIRIKKLKK